MSNWSDQLRPRLAGLRLSPAREAEIVDELSQHLDDRYEELRAGGASDADARRLAMEELREPEALAEQMRRGEARMLDDAPLVARAVDSMLASLRRAPAAQG